jgi:putative hydrolase of HD superfamily
MNVRFLEAISTLYTLQRWNFVPRIETWVEAENVAYVLHLIYAVGLNANPSLAPPQIERSLARVLLKSFNKAYLSDISYHTREAIDKVKPGLWGDIEKDASNRTLKLFPKEVRPYIQKNLIDPEDERSIESKLANYVQLEVARMERKTNEMGYPGNPYYLYLFTARKGDVRRKPEFARFRRSFDRLDRYAGYIKNMKYLRRWNRLNRSVETSVMSHTFVVAALALVAACIEVSDSKNNLSEDFVYKAVLRALFHDVPEVFTGDVISPVKKKIEKLAKCKWSEIEKGRLEPLRDRKVTPKKLLDDIDLLNLFSDLPGNSGDVVGKLVKDCDRLALLLECVFEKSAGRTYGEMEKAYEDYARAVLCSKWRSIREIALHGLFKEEKK